MFPSYGPATVEVDPWHSLRRRRSRLLRPARPATPRRDRKAMLGPLSRDEGSQRYRPIACSTQRAATTRAHPQLGLVPAQPAQLSPLGVPQQRVTVVGRPSLGTPVTHHPLVDARVPGDLRDRLPRLQGQPHRTLLEGLIELPTLPVAIASSPKWRWLHDAKRSPL